MSTECDVPVPPDCQAFLEALRENRWEVVLKDDPWPPEYMEISAALKKIHYEKTVVPEMAELICLECGEEIKNYIIFYQHLRTQCKSFMGRVDYYKDKEHFDREMNKVRDDSLKVCYSKSIVKKNIVNGDNVIVTCMRSSPLARYLEHDELKVWANKYPPCPKHAEPWIIYCPIDGSRCFNICYDFTDVQVKLDRERIEKENLAKAIAANESAEEEDDNQDDFYDSSEVSEEEYSGEEYEEGHNNYNLEYYEEDAQEAQEDNAQVDLVVPKEEPGDEQPIKNQFYSKNTVIEREVEEPPRSFNPYYNRRIVVRRHLIPVFERRFDPDEVLTERGLDFYNWTCAQTLDFLPKDDFYQPSDFEEFQKFQIDGRIFECLKEKDAIVIQGLGLSSGQADHLLMELEEELDRIEEKLTGVRKPEMQDSDKEEDSDEEGDSDEEENFDEEEDSDEEVSSDSELVSGPEYEDDKFQEPVVESRSSRKREVSTVSLTEPHSASNGGPPKKKREI